MTDKILKILEFGEITKRLSKLAITAPAKDAALKLRPSGNLNKGKNLRMVLQLFL